MGPAPKTRGFTLLELLLAVTLLAVGTVGVMTLMHQGQMGTAEGESVLTATYLAQRRLEELKNVSYASVANEARTSVSDPAGYTRFDREVTVTTPYTNLKQIVVTVYWDVPSTSGETSLSLQTYRSAS